ncbi:glycosyltransferase family 2 protein [Oenococcus oeni]|uniref:glycosyltransferase family 2 protein n=1 Tax=Oenococcus oeni TaxID=1247 RepID=UPI0010B05929|nr:glycosyltransferase family 2 protein [Oenococcus oeni]SYW15664.1 putative glycosyltransferase [Oenococcus oeni]
MQKIGLVILNYNNCVETSKLLSSVIHFDSLYHIVIVDNKSTDSSFENLLKHRDAKVSVISTKVNHGYGSGNNVGAKFLIDNFKVEYVMIANPDVSFDNSVVKRLTNFLESSNLKIGTIAPTMKNSSGKIVQSTWKLPTWFDDLINSSLLLKGALKMFEPRSQYKVPNDQKYRKVGVVTGSLFMIKSVVFKKVDFFDERTFLYDEENILAIKLKKSGYENIQILDCYFQHSKSTTISKEKNLVDQYKYYFKSMMIYHTYYADTNKFELQLLGFFLKLSIIEKKIILFIHRMRRNKIDE